MRLVSLAVCVFLTGCATTVSRENRERASLHLKIGTGFLAKGQNPQAMTELQLADQLNPQDPNVKNALGLAYFVRGRYAEAEASYREALRLAPNFSEAKTNLARLMIDRDRVKEAIALLRQVEGDLTYPNQDKTFAELGMAFFRANEFARAEEYLMRSLQMNREGCVAANYYGRTLQEMKRWQPSAVALDQAVESCRASRFEEPLYFAAVSYFSLGNSAKSRARLEELLKDYPESRYVAKAKGMLGLLEQ